MYHASVFDVYDTKENHLLYEYFDRITAGAKNMYNVANFNIRQLMTGLRVKRGLYRTADGTLINADVNGALNIGRKYDPWMFENMTSDTRKRYASSTAVVGYRALHPESKGK